MSDTIRFPFFQRSWFLAVLFAVVVFLCYSHSLSGAFVFDDITGIVTKPAITHPTGIRQIWEANASRFLTNLSFAANFQWHRHSVYGYHLVNLIIHWAVGIAVFGWIWELTRKRSVSIIVAILFLMHPLESQAVAYISQRSTALAAFWYISALWAWTRFFRRGGKTEDIWLIALSSLSVVAALLSKEYPYSFVVAVVVLGLLFPHLRRKDRGKRYLLATGGMVLLTIVVYLASRTTVFSSGAAHDLLPVTVIPTSVEPITAWTYLLTQGKVIVRYLSLLFWPVGQTIDHSVSFTHSFSDRIALIGWGIVSSIGLIAVHIRHRYPVISFGVLFFLLTIAMESSFFPIADAMMEHRVYLPSIGIFLAVVWASERGFQSLGVRPVLYSLLVGCLLVACLTATRQRVVIWHTGLSLWEEAVRQSPRSARSHFNYGGALLEQGDSRGGLRELRQAARLDRSFLPALQAIEHILQ